ncbi:MAG: hypothetical protein C5B56_00850 [Proteobacteria bacterium]|nr:MAG: hypothetical protein C5B56_00850 [Pseudomonadota bacterium]
MPAKSIATLALLFCAAVSTARGFDDAAYPDLRGQWIRITPPGQPGFDPSKPRGRGQEAPLTAEYQAVFEENLKDMAAGGEGLWPGYSCRPPGMPAMMTGYEPLEIIVLPEITYIRIDHIHDTHRRIYTDGRAWPAEVEPTFAGYSIGAWRDENNDGRYDVLEVETRHIKGPRAYDASGLPLHRDNQTVVKERLSLDPGNPNLLRDQITVIDNALTRPWVVTKSYRRNPDPYPDWQEYICAENNTHVRIGAETYFVGGDGYLMPTKRNQPPPDLRYFKQTPK